MTQHIRIFALALSLSLVSGGCAAFSKVVWPATVKCSVPLTGAVVDEVTKILTQGVGTSISTEASDALEKLAADHGPELVACIVEQFITGWMAPARARAVEAQPPSTDAASRAQDFLARRGVTVSQ